MLVSDAYALYFCFANFRRRQSKAVNLLCPTDELIFLCRSVYCAKLFRQSLRRESLKRKKSSSLPDFLSRPTDGPCRHFKSLRSESANCLDLN